MANGLHNHFCLIAMAVAMLLFQGSMGATNYFGTPAAYLDFIPLLTGGDTLFLEGGVYTDRLRLVDVTGSEGNPLVITGPASGEPAVFLGNACCNTVSLTRCAYVTIRHLTLDGQDIAFIDAVKGEGTDGNWAHHIVLEYLTVVNHGEGDAIVGVNTKCPAWNWEVRFCIFIEPGLGMYLGAPDGTAAFVNGVIEYNLIVDPRRYGIQVKHQFEGSRDFAGMPDSGSTKIRYNVISKANNSNPEVPRPNLLVGGFPGAGNGSTDFYEIYGNLLWQNPDEGLFQGTGNFALYNNILVNHQPGGWGIFSFPHNNQPPRDITILNNTILSLSQGIRLSGQDEDFCQVITGNAIFSDEPIWDINAGEVDVNVLEPFEDADDFVQNPTSVLASLDLTPTPALQGQTLVFDTWPLIDAHLDFDYRERDWTFRGAYGAMGEAAWQPALEIRPLPDSMPSGIHVTRPGPGVQVHPNPVVSGGTLIVEAPEFQAVQVRLREITGRPLTAATALSGTAAIAIPDVPSGIYVLELSAGVTTTSVILVVSRR